MQSRCLCWASKVLDEEPLVTHRVEENEMLWTQKPVVIFVAAKHDGFV